MVGKVGCKCNGTGIVIGEFGLEEECSCVRELREQEVNGVIGKSGAGMAGFVEKVEAPNLFGELSQNDIVLKMGLIPKHRINDNFNENHVKVVAVQTCAILKCKIDSAKLKRYIQVLDGILTGLRAKRVPDHSYIIGASNGFGKTTFVNTAIKIMASNAMRAVPYISLVDLAEKWADYNDKLSRRLEDKNVSIKKNIEKNEADDEEDIYGHLVDKYDWADYVKADVAFVSLTSTAKEVMWIEMQVLKQLLELRGAKGRPTIVMTKESLDWYKNDDRIRKYVLTSIMDVKVGEDGKIKEQLSSAGIPTTSMSGCYDKLEHISTYLVPLSD